MFWGLIMEPGRCYTQDVKYDFHISMAALDLANASKEPSQVMFVYEGRNYLLCTLNKDSVVQCPLDLNFAADSKVTFAINGKSHVHLTGYLLEEGDVSDEMLPYSEKDTTEVPKKRVKKGKAGSEPPKKKYKLEILQNLDECEEESSDSDFNVEDVLIDGEEDAEEEEDGSDEEVQDECEEESENEENEEEGTSSLSDGDEEDGEEEDEEEKEEPIKVKPQQNGVDVKKQQQQKNKVAKGENKAVKATKTQQNSQKGIDIVNIKEGDGPAVRWGSTVEIYYEGRLKQNNKMFDSVKKGRGFSFKLGNKEVIQGLEKGLVGMKVGGKRRITISSAMAYGEKGSPPVIPPNSTLVFVVELKKIR